MTPEAQRLAEECKRLMAHYCRAILNYSGSATEQNVKAVVGVGEAVHAAIDKLASLIPAGGLAEETRWQPIETAPKVVGRIIGAVEGRARFICWGKASHVPLYGWILTDQGPEDCDLCQPTAWMPSPDAALSAPTPQQEQPR